MIPRLEWRRANVLQTSCAGAGHFGKNGVPDHLWRDDERLDEGNEHYLLKGSRSSDPRS